MRKKVLFILFCFFILFVDSFRVEAEVIDHSLNYDIEEFRMEGNNLYISGWAFIHNYNNIGNYNNAENSNFNLSFFFENNSGKSVGRTQTGEFLDDFKVEFTNKDLTNVMCYKRNGSCVEPSYKYENVGFKIEIPLENYLSELSDDVWNLKIYAVLKYDSEDDSKSVSKSEDLAVYDSVPSKETFGNNQFELSGIGKYIDVTGNHVTYENGNFYWRLTAGSDDYYEVEKRNNASGNNVSTYDLYNSGPNYTKPYGFDNCGFDENYSSGLTRLNCVYPGNNEVSTIKSTFVKPTGKVTIKYKGEDDKYCSTISDSKIDSCDGTPVDYVCNTMTVEKDGIKADVHLEEHAELYGVNAKGEYVNYPDITVYAGGFLDFKFIYKDIVSWDFVDNERNRSLTSAQKQTIAYAMSSYYVGLNGNNLSLVETDNSLKANIPNASMKENGKWLCSTNGSFTDVNSRKVITTCSFDIPEAYIKDGQVVYNSKSGYIATGLKNKFYIYRDYNLEQFKWNINSLKTLSTLKVRVDKNTIKQLEIKIDTKSNSNNSCYYNVNSDLYECPDSSCKVAIVYRSIDESNPFPKISSYLNYPENWKNYYISVGNLDRVKNSFSQKIDYKTHVLTADAIRKLNLITTNYTFDDVDVGGNVSEVVNGDFFEIYNAKHSKKGYYDKGSDTP